MTRSTPPVRRLALAAGLLAAVLMSCGREFTGPGTAPVNAFKRFASVAFSPQYETAVRGTALQAALTQVAFERVRITLRRSDGTIVKDTMVAFGPGLESLVLSLTVSLPADAPASGVPLTVNLNYLNAAGETVFSGGPVIVMAMPSTGGGTPPPPVEVPVHYTGIGSNATAVSITPKLVAGIAPQSTTFSAQALGSNGQAIPGTPIVFSSSNSGVVRIGDPSSGSADFVGRGTAFVYAELLTGQRDSAVVTVTLPATAIALVSGGDQVANAGSTLPQPVVAQVRAADGVGVAGVTVTFAVASGAGVITPASAVSGANGQVSASWKLGPTAGPHSITVTSAGLSGSPITVNGTALAIVASRLVMTTAPANGKAGSALPSVAVTAQDALGNTATTFTGDVSVAIGNNPGSATLGGTTTVKAVNGVATFSNLTLNRPGTAYTLAFSSSGLSGVTSGAFDVIAGDAAKLAFGPMTATADAGNSMGSVLVTAQDAAGNTVLSFTGAVTVAVGTNPGASTLSGTLTRAAVAGVATFNDLSLNKKGPSYTLVASAAGMTGATSAPFNVAPGAPSGLSIVSGNGQAMASGSLLSPIAVRLHDALGNGIEGASIAFAVSGGGGTLSTATAVTDTGGVARVSWTIGAGPQTMTATFAGLPSIQITATSTSAVLRWTGATSTAWNVAGNWSPAFVPTAVDVVTIPVTTNAPTISAPASVFSITVATDATLTNNSTLTVSGNADAGTTITGSGSVILAGASGTVKGVINQALTVTGAAYTLAAATQVTGPLTIASTGKLTVGGQTLTVTGSLFTSGGGRLAMTNSADQVTVTADANFAGGSENGLLTAGMLAVGGNFTATGSTFSATGSHALKLVGTTTTQTLVFTSPITGQGINHLSFENGAAKTMSGTPAIMGDVSILATSAPVDGSATVKIGGNFSDATIFPDSGGNPNPMGGWRVATTNFFGSNKTINSEFISSDVTVSGTVQLAPCTSCLLGLRANLASIGYVQVNGNVTASGAGAVLILNGNLLDVTGNFATANGGAVDLTNSMDYLYVEGSAVFGGGSTVGKLTLGTLEVVQDFMQSGAANSFAPDAGFYTYIGESYATTALRASRDLGIRSNGVTALNAPAAEAAHRARTQKFAPLRAARAERLARLDRRAAAYAARGMAAPSREQDAARRSTEIETASRLLHPARLYTGTSNITFANTSASFFGTLYLSGPEFILASDVLVAGQIETGYSASHTLYSSSTTPRKITSHGADVSNLGFDNVSWTLLDGSDVWAMEYVSFSNMDPTADQFTVARTSDERAQCDCSSYYELYNWYFYTTPTTGNYIKATDTNGGPNLLDLRLYNPYPTTHGGHVSTAGGAVITDWPSTAAPAVVTWTGATSTDWNVGSNWNGGIPPTITDDVLIPTGVVNQPRLTSAPGYAHNLTIEDGMSIETSCSYELYVHGNVVAPLVNTPAITTCEGDAIHLVGDGTAGGNTVVGNFEMVKVEGNYKVSGPGSRLIVSLSWGGLLRIDGTLGGNLTINGGRVDADQLETMNLGTLTMTNPVDQLVVGGGGGGSAHFNGGSTAGKLTAGLMSFLNGACLYTDTGASDAFAPSGTHMVVFAGTVNCVSFAEPTMSYFQDVTVSDSTTLSVESSNPSYPNFGFNANGTLARLPGTRTMTITSPGGPRINNVAGLNITGGPTSFDNIGMRLVLGTTNATLNTVAFTGFAGYMGPILTVGRNSPEIITFNALDFSAVTGLSLGGVFLNNSSTATVNIRGSTPGTGVLGTQYTSTGGGTVSWHP